jgi:hypothetical protein
MPDTRRLRGQEVSVIIVADGQILKTITKVQSVEINTEVKILEEGYLGETVNRYDEILIGYNGKLKFHLDNPDYVDFFQLLTERAARRREFKVNITATFAFANGQVRRGQLQDVAFGDLPLSAGGRAEYVQSSLNFKGSVLKWSKQ